MTNEYEYVEKILLKGENFNKNSNKKYGIFVEIPIEDLINEKKMKDVFEENIIIEKIQFIKSSFLSNNNKCKFYIFILYNIYNFLIHITSSSIFSWSFDVDYKINNIEEYIKLIKKVGEYYQWEDNEGKLIENMEKKQLTLFSLLYKSIQ